MLIEHPFEFTTNSKFSNTFNTLTINVLRINKLALWRRSNSLKLVFQYKEENAIKLILLAAALK